MAPVRGTALQRDEENHRRWWMRGGVGDDLQCWGPVGAGGWCLMCLGILSGCSDMGVERGRYGHASVCWAHKSDFSKKPVLKPEGWVQADVAVLLLGRYLPLLLHFSSQSGRTRGRSQFPPLLGPDKILGEEQCGSTYSEKPVNRNNCSSHLTSFFLCSDLWGGKHFCLGRKAASKYPHGEGAALVNIFNRNGLSSHFCGSCLHWRACFTARSVNCCTVELSVSQCWIYHTNSFTGGVKQQLASTGRERNNLPLSNQMCSKQRCSPNSFSSPLVPMFLASLLTTGQGVRAVTQLHHCFFRLHIR